MPTTPQRAEIFTDGAASPNPGAGGYAAIVVCNGERRELSGGFRRTTNNRMELTAVIEGLQALDREDFDVTVYSDSRYVVDMFTGGHARRWRANGWMRDAKHAAVNPDLWGRLLDNCDRHRVAFEWVKGHNDHPENSRCDELAVAARQRDDLPADAGYEAEGNEPEQMIFNWSV